MSVKRPDLIERAKEIAQDPFAGPSLLSAPDDYRRAVEQALEHFTQDRPNNRAFHHPVTSSTFRFVLLGTGTILPTTGLDRWVDGGSFVVDVWHPYDVTSQGTNMPMDRNFWRVLREPTLVVLELLITAPSTDVLRLEYITPHVVDATNATLSSILEADVTPLQVLTASMICTMAARRYVQNTGSSTFQNETVDRRTQSDIMASRAKELMKAYDILVGKVAGAIAGVGAVRKIVVPTRHGRGRLWHLE